MIVNKLSTRQIYITQVSLNQAHLPFKTGYFRNKYVEGELLQGR